MSNNISTEISTSYITYKAYENNFKDAIVNEMFGSLFPEFQTPIKIKSFPIILTLQYHTPNLGIVNPYIGLGYGYMFLKGNKYYNYIDHNIWYSETAMLTIKTKNAHSPVFQIGSNIYLYSNIAFNIDIKYFLLKPKYDMAFSNDIYNHNKKIISYLGSKRDKLKINPINITVGLTYTF
ncbi:Outer membrane protein W [Rickettsiales bacterium Ac37b]|nr:Outer membrane protein W [Rickettsiales bacterium Ac37b]